MKDILHWMRMRKSFIILFLLQSVSFIVAHSLASSSMVQQHNYPPPPSTDDRELSFRLATSEKDTNKIEKKKEKEIPLAAVRIAYNDKKIEDIQKRKINEDTKTRSGKRKDRQGKQMIEKDFNQNNNRSNNFVLAMIPAKFPNIIEHLTSFFRSNFKPLAISTLSFTGLRIALSQTVRRQVYFWTKAFPIYLHYRVTEYYMQEIKNLNQEEQNIIWDKLHQRHAVKALHLVRHLQGYFVKIAQLASARVDILPPIWVEYFSLLQDDVPGKSGKEISKLVRKAYNIKSLDEIFDSFDLENPLGSASIGQTHLATLKESGETVVVKVMYPDAEDKFYKDMATMRSFATIAQPAYVSMLDELRRQFMAEFDYLRESSAQQIIRRNMKKAGYTNIIIPKPILKYCTKNVLVMEYIPGDKLINVVKAMTMKNSTSALESPELKVSEEDEKMKKIIEVEVKEKVNQKKKKKANSNKPDLNHMYSRMNPLDISKLAPSKSPLLQRTISKIRKVKENTRAFKTALIDKTIQRKQKAALASLMKNKERETKAMEALTLYSPWYVSCLPKSVVQRFIHAKAKSMVDHLTQVHGHQILINGFFNGDPHPGNILLTPKGEIGLIDYGQIKEITTHQRKLLARLIVALADEDQKMTCEVFHLMGFKTKNMDPYVLQKVASLYFDRDGQDITEGKNLQKFFEELQIRDPFISAPENYIMAARVALFMRGMATFLGYEISIAKAWKPFALKLLKEKE